jgi:adenosylcobinamide kinase / adenosylcobinamide-phosphate guanylyltransferase
LITGPARSGKSEWAETLAAESSAAGRKVIYIATAQRDTTDLEWQSRIDQHRQRRSPDWQTWEIPLDLASPLRESSVDCCLLIDSLGTWLANHLSSEDLGWQQTADQLIESLKQCQSQVILVAEESGWGVVPAYAIGRRFRDRLGDLIRRIGAIADRVYLVTGGYALNLSQWGTRLPPPTSNQSSSADAP